MNNYNNNDFQININNLNESQISIKSTNSSNALVEEIKKVKILINGNQTLYYLLYETNLDRYDLIKTNIETILLQTECIIIMWDKSNSETFDNIPNLISTINEGIKEHNISDIPIFLIKNKIDKDDMASTLSERSEAGHIKTNYENIKKENKNLICKEISLLDKKNFYDLIDEIIKNMNIYKEKKKFNKDAISLVKFNEKQINLNNNKYINNISLNIILLGNSNVGKTSFFSYFLDKKTENYISTIGIKSLELNAEINQEKVNIKLYDTAGQEKFTSISKNFIRNALGILLLFDVTNKDTFNQVDRWISDIKEVNNEKELAIILIGNKIDCKNRGVSQEEAKRKANKYNIKYFESCCLNGLNLYEIFNEIILESYYKYYNSNEKKRRKTVKIKEEKTNKKGKKCC